jgi:hypothetical protein
MQEMKESWVKYISYFLISLTNLLRTGTVNLEYVFA